MPIVVAFMVVASLISGNLHSPLWHSDAVLGRGDHPINAVEASIGIDFAGLWFKWLNGSLRRNQWPPKVLSTKEAASSWIMPLRGEGKLIALKGIEQASAHPDCKHILIFAELGKIYRPYPHFDGFLAIFFGKHENYQSGKEFLDFLDNTVSAIWLKD